MILDILNQLADTTKRTEKEKVLTDIKGQPHEQLMKTIFIMTYDPSVDFYIKEFNDNQNCDEIMSLKDALIDLTNVIATRSITGNMAKQWVEMTYSSLSEDNAEVFKRVIKRDLRCGISAKTINKIWPDLIYIHPYMRCSGFSEKVLKNLSYPCYSQTKMDGLYCDIIVKEDKVEYRSRGGSFLGFNEKGFDKKLCEEAKDHVLMGEALALDEDGNLMDRASSNGYLNSNDIDINRVRFYLWDTVTHENFQKKKSVGGYSDRFNSVTELVNNIDHERLSIVDSILCEDQDEIIAHFKEKRLEGEEGTVIKDLGGIWKDGTSKDQVKVKVVFDCEMKLVGWKEGTGRNKGKLGAFTFQSSDGIIKVSAGTGYKDHEREAWYHKADQWVEDGLIACVRANDVTFDDEEGYLSLFLPRFVEWRTDKSEADSAERIKEQVKSFTDALKMIGE